MKTIGDHLRKRRLDLKLTKRDVAKRFGVNDVTIYLWEKNRGRPSLAQIPKIIEFLGRDPFEAKAESLGDRIHEYRRTHGLSQRKLARFVGVNPSTIAAWEIAENLPKRRNIDKLLPILSADPWFSQLAQ